MRQIVPRTALGLALLLAGCIAPEEPEARRVARPVSAPAASANFEAAPTPNRAVGPPAADQTVRISH